MPRTVPPPWIAALALASLLPGQAGTKTSPEVRTGTWSRFRGPAGQGIADSAAPLPSRLDETTRLWDRPLPPGHSSPCVYGDRIFLTASEKNALWTLCIDRERGEVLWRHRLKAPEEKRMHRVNGPATPTPTANRQVVVVYFGSFGLLCFGHDGTLRWTREIPPGVNTFGTGSSPILADDTLILQRDTNDASFLLGLDPDDGEERFRIDRTGFPSGWSTPSVRGRGADAELLVYGAFKLTAYSLTGEEKWSVPGLADEPCISPVCAQGLVYASSYNMRTNPEVIGLPDFETLLRDYDTDKNGTLSRMEVQANRSILSRADADGEGDHPLRGFFRFLDRDRDGQLTAAEWQRMSDWLGSFKHRNALVAIRPGDGARRGPEIVWQHGTGVPECPSPLFYQSRIYLVKNGGMITCLDAATGAQKYQGRLGARGPRYASPVAGDGKIYTVSARGDVTVIRAADTLKILSASKLGERVMATPALVDGTVYLRTEKRLLAFRKKS